MSDERKLYEFRVESPYQATSLVQIALTYPLAELT